MQYLDCSVLHKRLAGDASFRELRTGTSILARLRAELDVARQELANALRKVPRLEAEIAEARATVERLRGKVRELEQRVRSPGRP
jgi:chromosome segregation ATPase